MILTTALPVTYLFVPGDRPDRFAKALASGADRIILDLEDAVRQEVKSEARAAIRSAELDWSKILIRINDAASPHFAADCETLAAVPAAGVVIPKAERAATLDEVRRAAGRPIELIPQIETVAGLYGLDGLLAVEYVSRAAFGHLDFALDLGSAPDWDALAAARSMLVLRSRLAGAGAPIDSVTPDLRDIARLTEEAAAARRFGFGAKLLIHPGQVEPVAQTFAPSAHERAWAERVIAAVANAGAGAVALDGKMIDKPVEDAARRILAREGN
ncbi:MAG: CoA ester lyase [Hyphomicrobiales bacterium]|nr:CoA ester lyase [Hyphomicrobiales bacterium]